jgi:hypothetical protein
MMRNGSFLNKVAVGTAHAANALGIPEMATALGMAPEGWMPDSAALQASSPGVTSALDTVLAATGLLKGGKTIWKTGKAAQGAMKDLPSKAGNVIATLQGRGLLNW